MTKNLEKAGMLSFATRFHHYSAAAKKSHPVAINSVRTATPNVEPGSVVPLVAGAQYRFHLPALLADSKHTPVLADSGSQGMFMGYDMAKKLGLKPKPLARSQEISYANPSLGETVTHYVTCRVQIGSYWKDLNFMLSNMGASVILGVSWFNTLQFTNLDWAKHSVSFN
jgi:predicted aspartyl protease